MRGKTRLAIFLAALAGFDSRAEDDSIKTGFVAAQKAAQESNRAAQLKTSPPLPQKRLCSDDPIFSRLKSDSKDAPVTVYYPAAQVEQARAILLQAEKSYRELRHFFNAAPSSGFSVYLAQNRAHLNLMYKKQSPEWVVGFGLSDSEVAVLDPKDWTEGSRKFVNLDRLIKHEMVHAFTQGLNGKKQASPCFYIDNKKEAAPSPFWFEEGLAVYVSGQLEDWANAVRYDPAGKRFAQMTDGGYPVFGTIAEFLFERFGRDKILAVIRALPADYLSENNRSETERILYSELGGENRLEADWLQFVLKRYPSGGKPAASTPH